MAGAEGERSDRGGRATAARALHSAKAAALGTAAVVAWAAWRAAVDLDPRSLWKDDAWVVALARAADWSAWLASPSSAPPSFKSLVGLALHMGGDLELAAQAVPFALGLVAAAAVGWLAFRITTNAAVAVLAAAFVAGDPVFLIHMTRVKPYTADVAAAAAVGIAFDALLRRTRPRELWIFVGVCALALALSSLALFTVGAAAAVAAPLVWRCAATRRHRAAAGAALAALVAAVAGVSLAAPGFEQLRDFWQGRYLQVEQPLRTGAALARWVDWFVARLVHTGRVHTGPLPGAHAAGYLLAGAGALQLWLSGRRRHLAVGALVVAGFWAASALGRIPLGVGRVETFLLPYGAVLLASAAALAERARDARVAPTVGVALLALAAVQFPSPRATAYPREDAAPIVARLVHTLRPDDGLWTNLLGTWALGVYGPWELAFAPNSRLGAPHPVPRLAHFAIFDLAAPGRGQPPPATARVVLFVCYEPSTALAGPGSRLEARGYHLEHEQRARACAFQVFDRDDASSMPEVRPR